jgi:hypothetical protein
MIFIPEPSEQAKAAIGNIVGKGVGRQPGPGFPSVQQALRSDLTKPDIAAAIAKRSVSVELTI